MIINKEDVIVKLSQFENTLVAEIDVNNENINTDNFMYTFYLFLNGQRIEDLNYTTQNRIEFIPICDGTYKVTGFLKTQNGEKIIKDSNIINFVFNDNFKRVKPNIKGVPISIFGSCVSRDILNLDYRKNFNLKTYIARQSIVSSVSKPVPFDINEINLSSKFQREAVYHDFIKDTFTRLKNDGSKYLIIDLIDERFDIVKYNYENIDTLITFSAQLYGSGYIKKPNFIKYKKRKLLREAYYLNDKKLDYYLEKFSNNILTIFHSENIIINKCMMLNYYKDKFGNKSKFNINHIINNRKVNDRLEYMYKFLEKKFKNCFVMDFCNEYCADENHIWGLAPMHYQKEYYEKAFSELLNYVNK